jgi:hypothetical protein
MRISPEVRAAITEIARHYGSIGGKTAAKNMTAEQRKARARKAAKVAGQNRTARRLERARRLSKGKKKGE